MNPQEFIELTPSERTEWLNVESDKSRWTFGDDVFCLYCNGVFKAQDVACGFLGHPSCPLCKISTTLDFDGAPWWRDDLMTERNGGYGFKWIGSPIRATPGKPRIIPLLHGQ